MSYKCPNCGSLKVHYNHRNVPFTEAELLGHDTRRERHHYRCKDCLCLFEVLKDGTKLITEYAVSSPPRKELLANNLLQSVKWHKENCDDPYCGVSTFLLKEVYERLMGRRCTEDEWRVFV